MERLMEVIARSDIRALVDRYHAAINLNDQHLLRTVFTSDAIWEALPPLNLRFEGLSEIIAGLANSVARQQLLVQTSAALIIDFETEELAQVRSTLVEFGRESATGRGWTAVAFYFDEVRRDEGLWRFARRSLHLRYEGNTQIGPNILNVPESS